MRAVALSLALLFAACATTKPDTGILPKTFMKAAEACVEKCQPRTDLGLPCSCQIRVKIKARE